MSSFLSKVKAGIIAALAVLIPIVYVVARALGKKQGRTEEQLDRAAAASENNKQVADFYREMSNETPKDTSLHRPDRLVERLRDNGL